MSAISENCGGGGGGGGGGAGGGRVVGTHTNAHFLL